MLSLIPAVGLSSLYTNQYAQSYYGIIIYLFLAGALCGLLAGLAYVFSLSAVQDGEKRSEYECGFEPFDSATRLPFDVHFYLVGILFLIFDVEIALLFPWVLGLQTAGWFGFYLMLGFIFLLAIGFLYEWKRGALIWPSRQQKHHYVTSTNTNNSLVFAAILAATTLVPELAFNSIMLRKGRVYLSSNPDSNTKALLRLQAQRKILAKASFSNKLKQMQQILNHRRPNTQIVGAIACVKAKRALRNSKALLQSFVNHTIQQGRQCRDRNFTDERRITIVSKKTMAVVDAAIAPFAQLVATLKRNYNSVLRIHSLKRARLFGLSNTQKAFRVSSLHQKLLRQARLMKTVKNLQQAQTQGNQADFIKKVLPCVRTVLKARLDGANSKKVAGFSTAVSKTVSASFLFPVLETVATPSYAAQFFGGFGVELLFTGFIAGWLTYLAVQLGGEKSKKALALESLDFFNTALMFIIFCYSAQLLFGSTQFLFHGYFITSVFTVSLKLLTAYSGRFILNNSRSYIETHSRHLLEYPTVMALAILFMLLLVGASHLISGFLALVGFSLNLYVLILFDATMAVAREAGVKYFYLSTWSSGLMLYGIFLIFLILGTGQLQEIGQLLSIHALHSVGANQLLFALVCLFTGLFFKLSAFPGHMWAAEVYEGAADPITAFFMLPTKVAVLAFVVHILTAAFTSVADLWQPMMAASAIASLVWGCVAAYGETKTKRFLAYASINQIGFLLLGLATASYEGYRATLFYLFIYAIMNLGFLTVFLNLRRPDRTNLTYLTDFRGYATCVRSSWSLSVILLSMAGIPPLAGFFGKYYLLLHAQEQELYSLVTIGLFTSLISTYYYLRLIKIMWFEKYDSKTQFIDLNESKSLQLQLFEWVLWAVAFFIGPTMFILDIVTESLFTTSTITFETVVPISFSLLFFTVSKANFKRVLIRTLLILAHLLVSFFVLILLATLLVIVYHSLILLMSSWGVLFLYAIPAVTAVLAVGVTALKQPTHSLLCLIAVFFSTVLLYLYVGAEFLAFLFLIVYVGAIAILFLFVIMLLHLKEVTNNPLFTTTGVAVPLLPIVFIVILGLEDSLGYGLSEFFALSEVAAAKTADAGTDSITWFVTHRFEDIRIFSDFLYTYHCVLFFVAALLLLTAMLGAIILATQATDKDEFEA